MSPVKKVVVIGPRALARHLSPTEPEIDEWFAEIRQEPDMYYPEYMALCEEKNARPFSKNAWIDLCRS